MNTEREIERSRYKAAVQTLSHLPSSSQVEKRSQKMRLLFGRGVVPSSIVVEAERQLLEFTRSKQEQELHALEALAKIYVTEGRLLEMDL